MSHQEAERGTKFQRTVQQKKVFGLLINHKRRNIVSLGELEIRLIQSQARSNEGSDSAAGAHPRSEITTREAASVSPFHGCNKFFLSNSLSKTLCINREAAIRHGGFVWSQ